MVMVSLTYAQKAHTCIKVQYQSTVMIETKDECSLKTPESLALGGGTDCKCSVSHRALTLDARVPVLCEFKEMVIFSQIMM